MDYNGTVDSLQMTTTGEESRSVEKMLFAIYGMECPSCAMRIHNKLIVQKGVVDVHVDQITGTAEVEFNIHVVAIPALISAVAEAGNDGQHVYTAVPLSE